MKKIILFLSVIFFFFLVPSSNAQTTNLDSSVTYVPPIEDITGNTPIVTVFFNDLVASGGGENVFLCLESGTCPSGGQVERPGWKLNYTVTGKGISVCPDKGGNLKLAKDSGGKPECDAKDYFHEGEVYRLTLYADNKAETKADEAAFYINHFYPTITVSPPSPNFNTPIEISLVGTRRPSSKGQNNNYQIVVEGTSGYKKDKCITLKSDTEPTVVKFGLPENDPIRGLTIGSYTIKINEQVNEDNHFWDKCSGGFTYFQIPFTVSPSGGKMGEIQQDPNGSDYKAFAKFLNETTGDKGINLPCSATIDQIDPEHKRCAKIDTALGTIPTDPVGFITKIFQLVLSFAGLGVMLLIFYAGYRLLLSRGDKEVIQAQRERITAAIVGLLFIIFSLVLLSVIAGDVLKIPGFN